MKLNNVYTFSFKEVPEVDPSPLSLTIDLPPREITMTTRENSLDALLSFFRDYLSACGFSIDNDEHLEFVKESNDDYC
jgi:hypothetical protein